MIWYSAAAMSRAAALLCSQAHDSRGTPDLVVLQASPAAVCREATHPYRTSKSHPPGAVQWQEAGVQHCSLDCWDNAAPNDAATHQHQNVRGRKKGASIQQPACCRFCFRTLRTQETGLCMICTALAAAFSRAASRCYSMLGAPLSPLNQLSDVLLLALCLALTLRLSVGLSRLGPHVVQHRVLHTHTTLEVRRLAVAATPPHRSRLTNSKRRRTASTSARHLSSSAARGCAAPLLRCSTSGMQSDASQCWCA